MYCVAASAMGRFPRRLFIAAATVTALLGGMTCAQATVVITVNKSTQQLSVSVDGASRYVWPVSTARRGYSTPNGSYRPERLERKWYSRKYDWSPMPYSIFFDGGYAIHGSYEVSHLGRPASHGCVRLHPRHAAVLFSLVRKNRSETRIIVTGERPPRRVYSRARHTRQTSRTRHRKYLSHTQPTRPVRSAVFESIFSN